VLGSRVREQGWTVWGKRDKWSFEMMWSNFFEGKGIKGGEEKGRGKTEIRNLERIWIFEGKPINFWEDNSPLFEGKWHQKFREDLNFWGETDQFLRG
jgi:hypothetical protein